MLTAIKPDCPLMTSAGRLGRPADEFDRAARLQVATGERFQVLTPEVLTGFAMKMDRRVADAIKDQFRACPDHLKNRVQSLVVLAKETFERQWGEGSFGELGA